MTDDFYAYDEEIFRELKEEEESYEYYTLLNVGRNADQDEIKRAYRRLCRIYHPDRYQDEQKQKTATELFRRIQEAYKILSDPRTKSIYDKRGRAGLDDDLAVIERTTLPSELIEEYEKLRELWEERTFIQDCNPAGNFRMDINASSLIDRGRNLVTVDKFQVQQSVDAMVSKSDIGKVTGMLSVPKQQPVFGGIQLSLQHIFTSQNWVRFSTMMNNQPSIGVEGYHALGSNMYLTGSSIFSITNTGQIGLGMNASITRKLSDSTSGTISVKNLGAVSSIRVMHHLSPTTSLVGEASVGEEESYMKGVLHYEPFASYSLNAGLQIGTMGTDVLYGVEHNFAKLTTIGATVLFGPVHGVVLKMKFSRALMNFRLRIKLSDFIGLSGIFYATTIPLVLYALIKGLAIAPILRRERLQEIMEKKNERAKEILKKKKMAESAIELMQETFERIMSTEQAKHGLLIIEAWYGKLIDHHSDDGLLEPKVINVQVPLQCLVVDSKLILRENSKADLPGFYDPCIGEKKSLRVIYEFRGMPHEVTVGNSEPLIIPRMSHRVVNLVD